MAEFCNINSKESNFKTISQQRLASRKPRGTKLDPSGCFIKLKGARNYTPYQLSVGPDEIVEDIILRGLRADGLSTKLGIKNNKNLVAGLVSNLLQTDVRHDEAMDHFHRNRQKNNSAKNIYSTMTSGELNLIKQGLLPPKIDCSIKKLLYETYYQKNEKVQSAINIIEELQQVIKDLINSCGSFSSHNFITRGFFHEVFTITCSFITQLLLQGVSQFDNESDSDNKVCPSVSCLDDLLFLGADEDANKPTTVVVNSDQILVDKVDLNLLESSESSDVIDSNKIEWIPVEVNELDGKRKIVLIENIKEDESLNECDLNDVMTSSLVDEDDNDLGQKRCTNFHDSHHLKTSDVYLLDKNGAQSESVSNSNLAENHFIPVEIETDLLLSSSGQLLSQQTRNFKRRKINEF